MRRILATILLATSTLTIIPTTTHAAGGRCPQYEPAMTSLAPRGGWDVKRISYFSWRESRCTPGVVSRTNDHGLLQINRINFAYLSGKFGVPTSQMATWLKNPTNNIRAAAKLCEFARRAWGDCYRPWRT